MKPTQKKLIEILEKNNLQGVMEALGALGFQVKRNTDYDPENVRLDVLPTSTTISEDVLVLASEQTFSGAQGSWCAPGRTLHATARDLLGWLPKKIAPKGEGAKIVLDHLAAHQPQTCADMVQALGPDLQGQTEGRHSKRLANILDLLRGSGQVALDPRTGLHTLTGWRVEVRAVKEGTATGGGWPGSSLDLPCVAPRPLPNGSGSL
jgi:hypothetical protein